VMPRPEALPFVRDAKRLGIIQKVARRRYRDDGLGDFDASLYGQKVRSLIDEHVAALDIAVKIPPVSITTPDFLSKVNGLTSEKAKASEMEHALKFHIRKNFDQDPARFAKLSERLDDILKSLSGKWDQLVLALTQLTKEASEDQAGGRIHGDLLTERIYGVLESEFITDVSVPNDVNAEILQIAETVAAQVIERAGIVRFWHNPHAQEQLRKQLVLILDGRDDLFPFNEQAGIADQLMELARANRALISSGIANASQS
jgi:type I restriction enzyme R subunit